jgi:hypothetical protein
VALGTFGTVAAQAGAIEDWLNITFELDLPLGCWWEFAGVQFCARDWAEVEKEEEGGVTR